ncbi:fimbrial protein [Enterobacter soli]|uniref:fimbrial protein n=1 Tax=Enterobacter soli TaxID=885040 RepID=UPI003EDAAADE
MPLYRYVLLLITLSVGTFFVPHVHAASCTTSDLPYTISPGKLSVSPSLDVGGVIPGSTQTHSVTGSCTGTVSSQVISACYEGLGTEVSGLPGVYETNVSGVGIELLNSSGQVVRGKGSACDSTATPVGTLDSSQNYSFTYTVKLIKTASTVEDGTLTSVMSRYGFSVYNNATLGTSNTTTYSATIAPVTTTCSVDPLNLTVTLGDFPVTQFTHVGSSTGWKNFTITATCDSATTFTASVTSANGVNSQYDDVINLTPGSDSATGVGVRMLLDGVDLKYDYPIPVGGSIEPNVPTGIPFSVQYYQTDEQVTAGKANTVMTIDLEYK